MFFNAPDPPLSPPPLPPTLSTQVRGKREQREEEEEDPDDERDPLPYIMSVVWRAGRLSQQLLIDLALLVESNNLRFITTHQPQFRADLYNHVQDHVFLDDADDQPLRLGAKVILPSTHKGSARYMQQRFQDAMAVVVRLGRSSLFLTVGIGYSAIRDPPVPNGLA